MSKNRPFWGQKLVLGLNDYLLLISSLIIIIGGLVYYFYALNWLGIFLTLILVITILIIFPKIIFKKTDYQKNCLILNKKNLIFYLVYLIFFSLALLTLSRVQSSKALISPWQVVDTYFFLFYFLASFSLVITCSRKKINSQIKILLISLHYFLSFGVAIIVYKIGYGFDPFIHQAAMELIDKHGLVLPKTPYYLGEYSLIIIIHKISGLSIYFLNKILVPTLGAIFLPLAFNRLINKFRPAADSSIYKYLTIIFLPILTFPFLTVTTPQNLAYLFLILTILNGLIKGRELWTFILALATLIIHPLSGLPAILFILYQIIKRNRQSLSIRVKKIFTIIIFFSSALILPLALLFANSQNSSNFKINLNVLLTPFKNIFNNLSGAGQEDWLLNFIYFFGENYSFFLLLSLIGAIIYFYKQSLSKQRFSASGLILISSSLVIAYLLAGQIAFNDLINYEQNGYAERILILIIIFLSPYLIFAFYNLIKLILTKNYFTKILWLIFGLFMLEISLYLSYPRFDKYFSSRGYSLSIDDLTAVKTINTEATGSYVVLANQQVSVAALKELGFEHYYETAQGPIYFYPIPTGGPLYQYYLEMVYKNPERKIMNEAMKLVGVEEAYLVINKYWSQSDRIINKAKLTADNFQAINNNVYIFQYQMKK